MTSLSKYFNHKNSFLKLLIICTSIILFTFNSQVVAATTEAPATMATTANQTTMAAPAAMPIRMAELSAQSKDCIGCHKKKNPSLYNQWGRSKHHGANVGCYECHKATPGSKGSIKHENYSVSVIVSPKVCSQCHADEVKQFSASHHAAAAKILGSTDNFLAQVVEGKLTLNGASPVEVQGCWQCHGSEVKVLPNGDLDPATWPNTGIGRINLDGSIGSCTACHQRHEFSIRQARQPETCEKCHLGPDHPQKEIYEESKHGIAYYTNIERMNLDSSKWIVGEDYDAAPTCATCHMSATKDMGITHDVGNRISWTLRPPISEKIDAKAIASGKQVKPWQERRKDMQDVCKACHTKPFIANFYTQYDSVVDLYDEKFAKPGLALIKELKKEKMLKPEPMSNKIDLDWFYMWHHEGRRARMGASMQGPDFVHWNGMLPVAEDFYFKIVPQYLEAVDKAEKAGNVEGAKRARKVLEDILARPEHAWFTGKEPDAIKAARAKATKEFNERYLQKQ